MEPAKTWIRFKRWKDFKCQINYIMWIAARMLERPVYFTIQFCQSTLQMIRPLYFILFAQQTSRQIEISPGCTEGRLKISNVLVTHVCNVVWVNDPYVTFTERKWNRWTGKAKELRVNDKCYSVCWSVTIYHLQMLNKLL